MRHTAFVEVRDPLLQVLATVDREREVVEPDPELGELAGFGDLVLDEAEGHACGRAQHLLDSGRDARRRVLREISQPLHAEHPLVPSGTALGIPNGQIDVGHTPEARHVGGAYGQLVPTALKGWATPSLSAVACAAVAPGAPK